MKIETPAAGAVLPGTLLVKGTASDCLNITRVRLGLDGTEWIEAEGTTKWFAYLDLREAFTGEHSLVVQATNTRKEVEEATQPLEVIGFEAASTKLPDSSGILVHTTDIDGDGHVDLVMSDTILWGDGIGGATKGKYTIPDGAMLPVDVDNDGDLDLVCAIPQKLSVWRQGPAGVFNEQQFDDPGNECGRGLSAADIDGDGDIDFLLLKVIGEGGCQKDFSSYFFINDGKGNLEAVKTSEFGVETGTVAPGQEELLMVWPTSASHADLDSDGDLDLLIVGSLGSPTILYENRGGGSFAGIRGLWLPSAGQAQVVDYDGDGGLDIYFHGYGTAYLFRIQGKWSFMDVTTATQYRGRPFVDLNGDGWPEPLGTTRIRDDGGTRYIDARIHVDGQGLEGAVALDADGNGSPDLFLPKLERLALSTLSTKTETGEPRFLLVRLRRTEGGNRFGLGALIELYDQGNIGDRSHLRGQQVIDHSFEVRFAIDPHGRYDLRIRVPGSNDPIECLSCGGGLLVIRGPSCACQ